MKESQTEPRCSPIGPDNKRAAPNGASFRGEKATSANTMASAVHEICLSL